MKRTYQTPKSTVEPFTPLLLEMQPASGDGDYHSGMDVDARRRVDGSSDKSASDESGWGALW